MEGNSRYMKEVIVPIFLRNDNKNNFFKNFLNINATKREMD